MAGKGYGADATLVSAGFRLGQSYVPKDYTEIFKTQYEGLAEMHKAKAQAKLDFSKNLTENVGKFMEFKKEQLDEFEETASWWDEFEKMNTDYTTEKVKENADHYEQNGPMSEGHFNAAEGYMTAMKDEFEILNNKLLPNEDERKRKRELKRQLEGFRKKLVDSKANMTTHVLGWNNDFYNTEQSFRGEPDLQMLFSQIIDKDTSAELLEKKGIRISWEDGEKKYKYIPGRAGAEAQTTGHASISDEEWEGAVTISEKELFSRLKARDKKSVEDGNGIDNAVMKDFNKQIHVEGRGKVYSIENFETIEDKVEDDHYQVAIKSENPNDLYTSPILVGTQKRVYKNDLLLNRDIDKAVINTMGLGSEILTLADVNNDGVVNADDSDPATLKKFNIEKDKHEQAKSEIINILTNPASASQKKIAAAEYAKYRKNMLKNVFDEERRRLENKKKPAGTITPTTTTLFGNTVPLPSVGKQEEYATIQNIAAGKRVVMIDGIRHDWDPITEMYSYEHTSPNPDYVEGQEGSEEEITTTKQISREDLITRSSEVYGNITTNYFTTGANKVITHNKKLGLGLEKKIIKRKAISGITRVKKKLRTQK